MSGANSTRFPAGGKPVEAKPEKPRRSFVSPDEEYPLTVHPAGYYSKKIRGRVHYFGRWDQGPEAAEQAYRERKEDLEAGRTPKADEPQGYTVRDLLNEYRSHKKRMWELDRITGRTYFDCVATCDFLFASLRKERLVTDLRPDDFSKLYDVLAAKKREGRAKSAVVLGNWVGKIKQVFKFAVDQGKIVRAPVYGVEFSKPPASTVEKQKRALTEEEGERTFSRDEVLAMLHATEQPLKAMILLGINCGLGNSDIGHLRTSHIKLEDDGGWLDFPRPKTEQPRRGWLWPETVAALKDWLAKRPEPEDSAHARVIFITKYGKPWHEDHTSKDKRHVNPLSGEMAKLLKSIKINGQRGFYVLRSTYRTQAAASLDTEAVFYTMGHSLPGMAKTYVKNVHDERLQKVARTVREWLWPPEPEQPATPEAPPKRKRRKQP